MANRYAYQFLFSRNPALSFLQGQWNIGSSGAVSSVQGGGIKNIIRLSAGIYKILMEDSFARYLDSSFQLRGPGTGSTAVTAITPGVVYIILTLGNTTQAQWVTAGVPAGVTAAVGLPFLAAATSLGTGTVSTPASSGIECVEIAGNPNVSVNKLSNAGDSYFVIKCMGPTAAGNTAMIPTDPVSGSVMEFNIFLRNSSIAGKGE